MKPHKTARSAVVLATVAVLGLSACSGGSKSGSSGGGSSASGPSGTLRLASDTPPDPWDPADATPADPNMLYYQAPYDFLLNTDGSGKLSPGLATKWESTATSLTLTLRSGVTFTDGTPFDAAAVKANVEHMQKDGIPPNKATFINVSSVDVVSPTEVKFNLSHPTPQLVYNLARRQGLMASPKALQDPAKLKTQPVGTGGWILDTAKTVPNSKYVFTANPNYWNKSAQGFSTIEINYIPDQQARTNALLTHKVDWINYDAQFRDQIKAAGFDTLAAPGFPYYLEILDRNGTKVPAFADQRVREAIALAVDQATFYKVTENGDGQPSNQWTIPGEYGYNANYKGLGYNLDKAKALMRQAGVSNLEFTIPSYGPFDARNQAIAGFLAKIGITMKLSTAQTGNISGAAASGQFPAAIVPSHTIHPQDFYQTYISPNGTQNPFKVADPQVDQVISKVKGVDPAADEAAYQQMAQIVSDQAAIIPLGVINCGGAWDGKKLTGVTKWYWTCTDVRLAGLHAK